jgi:predicted outer membrane repeat protein
MEVTMKAVMFSLGALLALTAAAHATDRLVSTKTGDDGGGANTCMVSTAPCATIGQGLAQAADGDTIKIAKGVYIESLHISTGGTRTFQGGWDLTFTTRDPVLNQTTWKGAKNDRALDLEIFGASNTTIFDGMDLSKSKEPKGSFEPGAAILAFSGDGFGPPTQGALRLEFHDSTVRKNKSDAAGGAIELQQNDSSIMTLAITNTTFDGNTAEFTGGAIDVLCTSTPGTVNVAISDSTFSSNHSTSAGGGVGGALTFDSVCDNATVNLRNVLFDSNKSNGKAPSIPAAPASAWRPSTARRSWSSTTSCSRATRAARAAVRSPPSPQARDPSRCTRGARASWTRTPRRPRAAACGSRATSRPTF